MKHSKSAEFFDAMAQAYSDNEYGKIAQCYDEPGAIYMEDDILVWSDKADLIRFLKRHCASNYALGARGARPKVIAQSIRSKLHFSVWVVWQHLDQKGALMFETVVRYFCRETAAGELSIQLVEVPKRPRSFELKADKISAGHSV